MAVVENSAETDSVPTDPEGVFAPPNICDLRDRPARMSLVLTRVYTTAVPLEGSPGDPEGASEASLSGMKRAVDILNPRFLRYRSEHEQLTILVITIGVRNSNFGNGYTYLRRSPSIGEKPGGGEIGTVRSVHIPCGGHAAPLTSTSAAPTVRRTRVYQPTWRFHTPPLPRVL